MTATPASPRAVLGEPLDELARLASVAIAAEQAEQACGLSDHNEKIRLILAANTALHDFEDVATPERIAQLVALARAGMEDTARLDWLADTQRTDVRGSDGWELIGYAWGTYGGLVSLREAVDAKRREYAAAWARAEERYPDPPRAARAPAGPGGENA